MKEKTYVIGDETASYQEVKEWCTVMIMNLINSEPPICEPTLITRENYKKYLESEALEGFKDSTAIEYLEENFDNLLEKAEALVVSYTNGECTEKDMKEFGEIVYGNRFFSFLQMFYYYFVNKDQKLAYEVAIIWDKYHIGGWRN
ncbi:MAG: hypothetical protein PF569_03860 [Candidatus Woesearchaeota archaeon]|jgi:hypothetical protein|nr:hypothetical protein [Candidatus Woesearchaeota archaeon]